MSNIYIVAEIGCNHNGSVDIAREMILKAKEAGVNAVKFQTFKADKLISAIAPKAEYQIKNTGELESQLEMTKKLEMKYDDYLHLMEYAVSLNLDVFSTPFDEDSIDFLASLKQKIWKIPSGELLNLPYLEKIAKLPIPDKKIIISTGMATIDEIKQSVSIFINVMITLLLNSDLHRYSFCVYSTGIVLYFEYKCICCTLTVMDVFYYTGSQFRLCESSRLGHRKSVAYKCAIGG